MSRPKIAPAAPSVFVPCQSAPPPALIPPQAAFPAPFVQFQALLIKILLFSAFFVIVRWTVPRFRYDQVMNLGWRTLLPLALANILVTGLLVTVF